MRRILNWTQRPLFIAVATYTSTVTWVPRSNAAPICYKERFQVNADEVSDMATGLTWKKQPEVGTFNWEAAKSQCTGAWRLPSVSELQSIVDDSKSNPAIDNGFGTQALDLFWSSSPFASNPATAWAVYFVTGAAGHNPIGSKFQVRCVR